MILRSISIILFSCIVLWLARGVGLLVLENHEIGIKIASNGDHQDTISGRQGRSTSFWTKNTEFRLQEETFSSTQ